MTVPNVGRQDRRQREAELQAKGFTVVDAEPGRRRGNDGNVLDQNPAAERRRPGSNVVLTVGDRVLDHDDHDADRRTDRSRP